MKVNEKLSILFYLSRKRAAKKTGLTPIYVRITIDDIRDDFPSGKKCRMGDWNNQLKSVNGNSAEARLINSHLTKILSDLPKLYIVLEMEHGKVSPQMLKKRYLKKDNNSQAGEIKQQLPKELEGFNLSQSVDGKITEAKALEKEERDIKKIKPPSVIIERMRLLEQRRDELTKDIERLTKLCKTYFSFVQKKPAHVY